MGSDVIGAIVGSSTGEEVEGLVVDGVGSRVVGLAVMGSTVGTTVGGEIGDRVREGTGTGVT